MKKVKIGVLGSTRGTDLEEVIRTIKKGKIDAEISIVISDKKDAYILKRGKRYGIESIYVSPKRFSFRKDFDREISEILKNRGVDLILLIGYMRILSKEFVREWRNRIMNIHPSLLPAFAGGMDLNVHEEVLKRGVKITGCTLHFVDEGKDTGPIILQKAVKVDEGETPESLKEKVQKAEKEIIVKGIKLFGEGKIKVIGNKVKIIN